MKVSVEKEFLSSPQMSVILKIMGHFLNAKVSGKGSLLIMENNQTSCRRAAGPGEV